MRTVLKLLKWIARWALPAPVRVWLGARLYGQEYSPPPGSVRRSKPPAGRSATRRQQSRQTAPRRGILEYGRVLRRAMFRLTAPPTPDTRRAAVELHRLDLRLSWPGSAAGWRFPWRMSRRTTCSTDTSARPTSNRTRSRRCRNTAGPSWKGNGRFCRPARRL